MTSQHANVAVGRITIVGLGPAGPDYVTQQTLDALMKLDLSAGVEDVFASCAVLDATILGQPAWSPRERRGTFVGSPSALNWSTRPTP